MFFIISKILSVFFTPFIWIFFLLVISVFIKNAKKSRRLVVISVILLYVFSNSFLVDEVMRWWETPICKMSEIDSTYEAGIILGGGIVTIDTKKDRLNFDNNVDRFMQALYLYKKGRIKKFMISSGSGSLLYPDMLESSLLKRYMTEIGIPDSAIVIDSLSHNTRENAKLSSEILKKKFPHGNYLLITSAMHMRRAMGCFEKEGIIPVPFSTNKCVGDRRYDFSYLFVPDIGCFYKWSALSHEILGYITYIVMGYI